MCLINVGSLQAHWNLKYCLMKMKSQDSRRVSKSCLLDMLLINNMPKGKQPQSTLQIEMGEAEPSPHFIMRSEDYAEPTSSPQPAQRGWRSQGKQCNFLAMIVLCSLLFGYEANAIRISPGATINEPTNFQFMVFCPATDDDFLPFQNYTNSGDIQMRTLQAGSGYTLDFQWDEQYLPNNTYIVRIEGNQVGNTVTLYYCGRIRYFNDSCINSFDSCSSSPMFDLEEKGSIDIIWINNLDNTTNVTNTGTCMDPNPFEPFPRYCTLEGKANMTETYGDPTDMPPDRDSDLRIAFNGWPISTHVHGAEVRPTFDGNPISWISNDPDKKSFGVAAFSLNQLCYYSSFQTNVASKSISIPPNYKLYDINGNLKSNFKVNRYPNKQNPGTLWYHDHAMHLTSFNVMLGLAGFYILRDSAITEYLGINRGNEKFVLITNNDSKYQLTGFSTKTVYRFRFLNANYATGMTFRYSFSYNNCNHTHPDLQTFTLIGADSSLFAYGIENQTHFVISNAERIDLLIKFEAGRGSFSICGDANISASASQLKKNNIDLTETMAGPNSKFNIKNITLLRYNASKDSNAKNTVSNIDLSRWVSYTNLSNVPEEEVQVSRFRPLIIVNSSLTIHGRVEFHSGQSQNPVMGTIEDWFIINTMSFAHPIHIHLINFQVVKVYTLRLFKTAQSTCPYYQLDFVAAAVQNSTATDLQEDVFQDGVVNYTYLCDNIFSVIADRKIVHSLSEIYPENYVENKTSGLDLFVLNEDGSYKYILGPGRPSPKVYYQQWKDTAFVDRYQVLQFRTRWSKSNYTASVDDPIGSYFHAPADTMREYPGYVYHCHILNHEDNEMMRPIMLQLPEDGPALTGPCPQFEWSGKVPCINQRCADASPAA